MSLLNSDVKRGVFIIYLLSAGITSAETGVLQTTLFIAMLAGEIPSGMLADKYGRKTAIIFSFIFMILYGAGYLLFSSFTPFLIMFIVNGLAFSLQSGSDQALLYDYLKYNHKQEMFIKINSREKAISALSIAGSMALGGWLKDETCWIVLFLVFIAMKVIGLFLALFLTESVAEKDYSDDENVAEDGVSVRRFFFSRRGVSLLPLFIGFSLYEAVLTPTYIYGQTLLNNAGYSLAVIGFVYAAVELSNAVLYMLATSVGKRIKFSSLVIFTYLLLAVFLFYLPNAKNQIYFIFWLTLCLPSFVDMIYMDYVNAHYPSRIRASCISINSFISSSFISLSYVIYGYAIGKIGVNDTFMYSSAIIVIALPISCYGLFKLNAWGGKW